MTTPVTATWVGLHAILAIVLAAAVVRIRAKGEIGFGDGDNEEMQRALRVQQNFLEYVPLILLTIMVLEIMGAWTVALNVLGAMLFIARLLHAWGLGRSTGTTFGRFVGTLVTWIVALISGAWAALMGLGVL